MPIGSSPGRGPAYAPPFPWTDRDFAFHARASLRRRVSGQEDSTVRARGRASRGHADASLRDEVAHRIVSEGGGDALDVVVKVREGIVTLEGPVPERVTKEMLQAIVEACPGVRGVDNRLRVDWVDETPSAARLADAPAEPRPAYLSSTRGSPTTTMRRTE
jgi:osmotically-inducible protein OsmY